MNKIVKLSLIILVGILCTQTLYVHLKPNSEGYSIRSLKSGSRSTTLLGVFPSELNLGCVNLNTIADDLTSALEHFSGANSVTKSIIETTVKVIVMGLKQSNYTKDVASSNACLGNFAGSVATRVSECSAMLLPDDSEYSVLAFTVPVPEGVCSASPKTKKAAFCVAMGQYQGLPSLSIQANAGALSCLATAGGSGVGYALGTALEAGLDPVSLGVSLTDSFVKSTTIFTGKVEEVQISGNYYDYASVAIKPERFHLPKVFKISGSATRVIKVMENAATWVNDLSSVSNVEDVANLFGDLSMLVALETKITLALASKTFGLLPNIGPYQLGLGTLYATTSPITLESGQRLQTGVYTYVTANNVLPALIPGLITTVINKVGGLINTVLRGFGINISDILNNLKPTGSIKNNEFGFMVNTEEIGLLVQTSLSAITAIIPDDSKVKVQCSFKYNHTKFSCKLDVAAISKFFTGVISGTVWVIKEAKEFFDETGKAIAFVDKQLEAFTDKALQTTANGIVSGAIVVARYTAEAAAWASEAIYQCGFVAVTDITICGTIAITDSAICGYEYVTDAAKCGADIVTDAAKCGSSYVTSGAKCGYETVTDAAKCGTEKITDGAKCGWDTVTECLKNIFKGKFKCTSRKQAKSCSIAKTCQIEASCNAPNTCSVARSCNWPKTCNVAGTCKVAKDC